MAFPTLSWYEVSVTVAGKINYFMHNVVQVLLTGSTS